MAKNQIIGKIIAVSDRQTITGKEKSIEKRQVFLDCTRFDPYTGERGYENTPLLEFANKGLEKLETLLSNGLKKDDVVTITFDVQGTKYKDKDGKAQVFTSIRPYDIELVRNNNAQPAAPAPEPEPKNEDDLPF